MTNFYGIGSSGSNFFNSFFGMGGGSSSSAFPFLSGLGDLKMIQSGVYKKALKAYYSTQTSEKGESSSIAASDKADSNTKLSLVKSSAQDLKSAADNLTKNNYDTVDKDDLTDDVKKFVSSYNSTLNSTKSLDSYSILQTAVWATDQMNTSESLLNKVGITIKEDNTLELDEEKLKNAKTSDLKTLFSGSNSLASRISQKASTLANQSANQMSLNYGKSLYTMYGTYN